MQRAYVIFLAVTFCLFPLTLEGQTGSSGAIDETVGSAQVPGRVAGLLESNARGAQLLERALSASGGSERLRSLNAVSLDFEAEVAATFQGVNPNSPHRKLSRTGNLTFDIAGDRLVTRSETKWPDFTSKSHLLYRDGSTHHLDDSTSTFRLTDDDEVLEAWMLRSLPVLLKQLSNKRMSLRYEGSHEIEGRKYEAVSSPLGNGKVYRFYFSQQSNMPEIVENLHYSSEFGDIVARHNFSDFQTTDGINVPTRVEMSYNDHKISSYKLTNITLGANVKLQAIAIPGGFRPAGSDQPAPKMQTRSIADHVYLIENLAGRDYNVMFADLGEFLVVFEAPIDLWASKIALAEIRKVFPKKPIRFIMVSHFHDDHAAGIRTYMADGVSVITTPGNREYFERVARLKHTFHPENDLLKVAEPKFEIVRGGSHEIKGRNMTVEFIDLGPTPHVDENIVAYIPEKGILFQGDFFRVPADRGRPERLRDEGVAFLNKIKAKNLTFKHLVGVHGPIGNIEDLEKAYELRKGTLSLSQVKESGLFILTNVDEGKAQLDVLKAFRKYLGEKLKG